LNKTWNLPKIAIASFDEIKDERPAFLVTFAPAWNVVKDKLRGLNIIERVEATKATTDHWDSFLESDSLLSNMREQAPALQSVEVVYSVGDGLTADAAKYIATRFRLPLAVLPSALSRECIHHRRVITFCMRRIEHICD